jgi:hypothetical protein
VTTTDVHTTPLLSSGGGAGTNTRPAPAPLAAAGASRVGVAIALAMVAVGAVAVRDAVLAAGWAQGTPWLPVVLRDIDALRPGFWLMPAGTLVAVAGLGLTLTALAPRRRTASALNADTAVYLRGKDIGKIAGAAAQSVGGVLETRAKASPRRAVVRCRITGEATRDVEKSIAAAVSDALSGLRTPPRVVVRLRAEARS